MKLVFYVALLCAALSVTTASAADREWIRYNDLLRITRLDKFYAAPAMQRDKVSILATVKPNNPAIVASDIVFTVIHGDERKRIVVGMDGTFDPVINAQWASDNPKVLTSMPAGEKAGFSFSIMPVVPAGLQFDYSSLMASVKQVNALIKSQAGMMRFLMPTFVGIELRYAPGRAAAAYIRSGQEERTISADAAGVLRLPLEESWLRSNAQVTLSLRPQSFDFIAD